MSSLMRQSTDGLRYEESFTYFFHELTDSLTIVLSIPSRENKAITTTLLVGIESRTLRELHSW